MPIVVRKVDFLTTFRTTITHFCLSTVQINSLLSFCLFKAI